MPRALSRWSKIGGYSLINRMLFKLSGSKEEREHFLKMIEWIKICLDYILRLQSKLEKVKKKKKPVVAVKRKGGFVRARGEWSSA